MSELKFLLFVIFMSCIHEKGTRTAVLENKAASCDSCLYKIYKIDSLNSYYLIYAKRNNLLYKIISKKETVPGGEKIKNDRDYTLHLQSIWNKEIIIDGKNVSPSIVPHVTCLSFDDSTRICLERDSINDLHRAENLRGLYLLQK